MAATTRAIDYHVEVDRHYYSVPYALVSHVVVVDARVTAHTVELFYRGQRVASHVRSHRLGRHTTDPAHMPKAHQHYATWTPRRLIDWAEKSGAATAKLVEVTSPPAPIPSRASAPAWECGWVSTTVRLEGACQRALALGAHSYKSVESILKRGLDREPLPATASSTPSIPHDNVRGAGYYH